MRLTRVGLRNFRCYKDEIWVGIDSLTAFIGKNDIGKSTIFDALEMFFNDKVPDSDDGSVTGDKSDVRVICEFGDLPESLIIDANYPTSLGDEYLLNENGKLEVHKIFDCSLKAPKLRAVKARARHPRREHFNDILALKSPDLKKRASDLRIDLSDTDKRVNTLIRRRIWQHCDNLDIGPVEIQLDAEASSAKDLWEQVKKQMPLYALFKSDRQSTDQDPEAQDPMKVAVKEALKDLEQELEAITQNVEQKVREIADSTVERIREMDPDLARQLDPRFKKPDWSTSFKISLTGDESIPINKRGSGVRRLILLNFFRAKADKSAEASTGIIYAIEEPETSQHPTNQKKLFAALCELAASRHRQVLLSTHTPMLARLAPVQALRYLTSDEHGGRQIFAGDENTYRLAAESLGVLPDHNVRLFVGVEGPNDIEFMKRIARVLRQHGENVPDLEGLETAGEILFVPVGGSNLASWTSRLAGLNRPEFHLYDRDTTPPEPPVHQAQIDEINRRPNCCALSTEKRETENYLHPDAVRETRPGVEFAHSDYMDVPETVAKIVHEASGSPTLWEDLREKSRGEKISSAKKWLNRDAVLRMTPERLDSIDSRNEVRGWLNVIASKC